MFSVFHVLEENAPADCSVQALWKDRRPGMEPHYPEVDRLINQRPAGAPASPIRVEDEIAIASPNQDAEYMLCRQCEQIISKSENYVASVALQEDGTFPALALTKIVPSPPDLEWRIGDASALDIDAIARFAVSIVWRASASVSATFTKTNLGDKFASEFADYLLSPGRSFPGQTRLILEFMDPQNLPRVDRMVVAPESKRDGGFHVHQFCIFGMWFRLLVGGQVPSTSTVLSFVDTRLVLLSDGSRLLASAAKRAQGVTPKGWVARRP
jgi:hypothetical protein